MQNSGFKKTFVLLSIPKKSAAITLFFLSLLLRCSINYSLLSEPQAQKTLLFQKSFSRHKTQTLHSLSSLLALFEQLLSIFLSLKLEPKTFPASMALFSVVGMTFSGAPSARQTRKATSTTCALLSFGPTYLGTGFENPPPLPIVTGVFIFLKLWVSLLWG